MYERLLVDYYVFPTISTLILDGERGGGVLQIEPLCFVANNTFMEWIKSLACPIFLNGTKKTNKFISEVLPSPTINTTYKLYSNVSASEPFRRPTKK